MIVEKTLNNETIEPKIGIPYSFKHDDKIQKHSRMLISKLLRLVLEVLLK